MFQLRSAAAVCAALFVLVAHAEAATYFVSTSGNDANPGSQSQAFRTIRKGLSVLAPGDTLYVRGGTYAEQLLEIYFGSSGTAAAPITVAAYSGETVVLRPSTSQGNVARFQDGSISYVVVDGLVFDGSTAGGGGGGAVLYCGPTSRNLRLSNVELANGDGNGALCAGNSHEFRNLDVHHNGRSDSYSNSNGMYMTTDNTVIVGGTFHDNECYGVRFFDSDTSQSADNNAVSGARVYNNGFGVGLDGSSQCGSGGGGIVLGDINNMAYNNVIYGNFWGFNTSSNPSGAKLYNNTFYNNQNGIWVADGSSTEVRNNILFQNGTAITNNASGTILSNNLMSDPQFTDPSRLDFSLRAGSPAIDTGISLSTVRTDFRGVGRPQGGAYDIGAYEGGSAGGSSTIPSAPSNLRLLQ
jgi:parallel beta-helix repeat protein